MAGITLKIEGPEVAPGSSGGTVINLTLHQESGMAYLCKAEILLGIICIGIGVALLNMVEPNDDIPYYYKRAIYNGVPFWTGGLFILSGTFSVVGARHGGNWVHLATFLNLGSVVAGSVAFTLGLTEFPSPTHRPYFIESLCKPDVEYRNNYPSWDPITYPPYDNQRDQRLAGQCQEVLWALVRMWSSTQILLLILHIAALAIALFCFGYGLLRLCRSCWAGWKDYMAVEDRDASEELGKEQNPA